MTDTNSAGLVSVIIEIYVLDYRRKMREESITIRQKLRQSSYFNWAPLPFIALAIIINNAFWIYFGAAFVIISSLFICNTFTQKDIVKAVF
ncbi:hypothetical protein ACFSCX_13745 [Bacillus salitolerans]|uniref:Uncharacterized protein n=1 Tax=Bacillus salitolerans TaxID=1437434 RepID=A0ABW4LR28_9BACI